MRIIMKVVKRRPYKATRPRLARAVPALLLVGAVVGVAGVADASVPDPSGTIHGCYSASTGGLRVIDTALSQRCTTTEKALTWSAQSIRWRGTWAATTAYAVNDTVAYAGGSYLALAASTGKPPSGNPATWAVLAQRGAAGAVGPAGPRGPAGPAGPGATAISAQTGSGSFTIASSNGIVLNLTCGGTAQKFVYLTLFPGNKYSATGWETTGGNGAPLQAISDLDAGGGLQYSAPWRTNLDEQVTIVDSVVNKPVQFNLQAYGYFDVDGTGSHCRIWGTMTPAT